MPRYIPPTKPDEIYHWGLAKGEKRDNHEYIDRIDLGNGKYRYFYTQAELAAYKAGKTVSNTAKKIGSGLKEKAGEAKNNAKRAANSVYDNVTGESYRTAEKNMSVLSKRSGDEAKEHYKKAKEYDSEAEQHKNDSNTYSDNSSYKAAKGAASQERFDGDWSSQVSRQYKKKSDEYRDRYNNAPRQKVKSATRNILNILSGKKR